MKKKQAPSEQIFFYDNIAKIAAESAVGNRMNLPLSNEVEAPRGSDLAESGSKTVTSSNEYGVTSIFHICI